MDMIWPNAYNKRVYNSLCPVLVTVSKYGGQAIVLYFA
jgi:hypothetical protein